MRKVAIGAAALVVGGGVMLVVPPMGVERAAGAEMREPGEAVPVVVADGWLRRSVELVARDVDLSHLGVHTHANWVVFELPFDVTSTRVRNVELSPHTTVDVDLGAYHTPLLCLRAPSIGPLESSAWSKYTADGTSGTRPFWQHGGLPTRDPRTYVISVPTRVANAAACWFPTLTDPRTWRLTVTWEESAS